MKVYLKYLLLSALIFSVAVSAFCSEPFYDEKDIFIGGTDGYNTYRIPALIVTPKGTVLAFCEGRKTGRSDTGNIDIVLKRSSDGGKLWEPMEIIWDDGDNVCGNPCPVIDRETGTIWLLLTHNLGQDHESEIMAGTSERSRTVWVMKSDDDGVTWSEPVEITSTTKKADWTWYATGPGVGIQMTDGRLVVPCDFALAGSKDYGSHIIFSDDHGKTWQLGGSALPKCNECQVVELMDGSLLLNMRSYHGENRRAISTSRDGGMNWTEPAFDMTLIEPVCQASLIRNGETFLFSNPADKKRINMTIRKSVDDCGSWPFSRTIHEGPSAYSCLGILADGAIACLYERGEKHPYEKITFAVFGEEWLAGGKAPF